MTDHEIVYVDDDDDDGWENEDEGFDFSSYSRGKQSRSYASYWMDRFGGLRWSSNDDAKFKDALRTVYRTVNLIQNRNLSAKKGSERNIDVRWSDGKDEHRNSVDDNVVYLSPNLIQEKTRRSGWEDHQVVDVLIGSALTESAYKGRADYAAETRIVNYQGPEWDWKTGGIELAQAAAPVWNQLGRKLWFAAECLAAQNSIIADYPGFNAYFDSVRKYYTDPESKQEIQDNLEGSVEEPTVQNAVAATLWGLIHPKDELQLPKSYQKAVKSATDSIKKRGSSSGRASSTLRVLEQFNKHFKLEIPPPEEGGGGDGNHAGKDGTPSLQNLGIHINHLQVVANETGIENLSEQDGHEEKESESEDRIIGIPNGDQYEKGVQHIRMAPTASYKALMTPLRPLITGLKNRLKLRNEDVAYYERGLRRGELDEGSIYKLGFAPLGVDDPHIFEEKTILGKPDIAFMLLIDESGSMGCPINGNYKNATKYEVARKTAIVIGEALQSIDGVQVAILGHTANSGSVGMTLRHYLAPNNPHLTSLGGIHARHNNADGYAIQEAAKYLLQWFPQAQTKILIHVSDGLPHAIGYGGELAQRHIRKVCEAFKSRGVQTIAIGIDSSELNAEAMKEMYGASNWALLSNANQLPLVASNLISKTVQRESRF